MVPGATAQTERSPGPLQFGYPRGARPGRPYNERCQKRQREGFLPVPRTLLAVCAALLTVAAAGCSQVSSGLDALALPTFTAARLPEGSPFRSDVSVSLPQEAVVAAGTGDLLLAAGGPDGGVLAVAGGKRLPVAGGAAVAAGGGLALFTPAGSEVSGGRTYAYDSKGRTVWSSAGRIQRAWISPDGTRVAVLAGGSLAVLDGGSGQKLAEVPLGPAAEVSFARDGALLAADGARLALVRKDGTVAWSYKPGADVEFHAALAPDGGAVYVATGDGDDTVYAFRASGETLKDALLWKRQLPRGGSARPWAVSPDGREVVVVAGPDGRDIALIGAETGSVRAAWTLPQGLSVRGAAFTGDGRLVTLVSPSGQATPAVLGWVAAGNASAGGPGALAVLWGGKGPDEAISVSHDAILAPDGGWLWNIDRDGARASGMRLGTASEAPASH